MPTHRHTEQQSPDPPTQTTSSAAVVGKTDESVAALAALYQGEKTDASYIFNTAMVMMGVAVAYLVGAIPFVGTLSHGPIARLSLCLLPVPLWLVIAFHSLITLNAMCHGVSVKILEDALFAASALRTIPVERELVGSAAGDKIMDITQAKAVHKLTTLIVYVGVGLLAGGFTSYALYSATRVGRDDVVLADTPIVVISIVLYSILLIVTASSWLVGLRIVSGGRRKADGYAEFWRNREKA